MSHARSIETTSATPLTIAAQAPARTNRESPSEGRAFEVISTPCCCVCCVVILYSFSLALTATLVGRFSWEEQRHYVLHSSHSGLLSSLKVCARQASPVPLLWAWAVPTAQSSPPAAQERARPSSRRQPTQSQPHTIRPQRSSQARIGCSLRCCAR